ncbi:methyltransferase [Neobacillus bataviensis LMG 21833]|uniref:Methyltransferase n=1 Tax=Neobacillus bataviensis LMG 21833 TaxID=1117379 RepID=K6C6F5_9BACI|nr:methyltransferase [Neobacillus bataviensis]EKN66715.1 methyltransferase [Neobacillus bataviensis LMG 21833]
MKEYYYDKLLNIKTKGNRRGGGPANKLLHYHPYEPTPYSALEELFRHYEVKSSDRVVDFGCGKGRLNFYLHYFFHATVVGVEMNELLYQAAVENQGSYERKTKKGGDRIQFHCCLAEEYVIDARENRFYFFNPFSIQVFRKIVDNILLSVGKAERGIELVLYYPSADYIYFLENYTSFELKEEVLLPHLYEHNPNERFLIYRLEI